MLQHLRDHPDQTFSPTKLAQHLERSAGAVANALASLTQNADAELVSAKPRRYRAAPHPQP